MNSDTVLTLARETLTVTALLCAPLLGVAVIVGLVVSVFQTVTSIHEQTLTFVPKVAAVLIALVLLLPWLISTICRFTVALLTNLPRYGA